MLLALHLVVAIGSMAYATYLFFVPSRNGIRATYGLVALTLATGFGLVFTGPAHMVEVCVTGLVYVGYVSYALIASRSKLAKVVN